MFLLRLLRTRIGRKIGLWVLIAATAYFFAKKQEREKIVPREDPVVQPSAASRQSEPAPIVEDIQVEVTEEQVVEQADSTATESPETQRTHAFKQIDLDAPIVLSIEDLDNASILVGEVPSATDWPMPKFNSRHHHH